MKTRRFSFRPSSRRNKVVLWAAVAVVGILAFVGASAGIVSATDSPTFCNAACHEMRPYHAAWTNGPHSKVACVECHVDPGPAAHVEHKFVALQELKDHLFGDPRFPRMNSPEVPNERCIRCHPNVQVNRPGFSHAQHAARRPCQSCHPTSGHEVSTASLQAEGHFDPVAAQQRAVAIASATASGSANLPGHIKVDCSNCHVMASTKCSSCHQPPHPVRGECSTCHKPGPKFVFTHPSGQLAADCSTCHAKPVKPAHTWPGACTQCHTKPGVAWTASHPSAEPTACATCHPRPAKHRDGTCSTCHATGVSWKFVHPGTGATCTTCHARPSGHRQGLCSRCHVTGVSWTFKHPANTADCQSCHDRPSGHRPGSCTTCHSTGTSWTFKHPTGALNCATCHARPSGHRSGTCTTCHRAGSWTFNHPASTRCVSCHKPPSNHFGTACASCHSHSAGWANAHFRHPSNTGAHSYRSFACTKCHPSGYSSHFCSCHGTNNGPGD